MDGKPTVNKLMCETGGGDIGSMRWAIEPHSFCYSTAEYMFAFFALPISPTETHLVAKWLLHEDAVEGEGYDLDRLIDLWTRTNLQDKQLAENDQVGVNSPGYRPGLNRPTPSR